MCVSVSECVWAQGRIYRLAYTSNMHFYAHRIFEIPPQASIIQIALQRFKLHRLRLN